MASRLHVINIAENTNINWNSQFLVTDNCHISEGIILNLIFRSINN